MCEKHIDTGNTISRRRCLGHMEAGACVTKNHVTNSKVSSANLNWNGRGQHMKLKFPMAPISHPHNSTGKSVGPSCSRALHGTKCPLLTAFCWGPN